MDSCSKEIEQLKMFYFHWYFFNNRKSSQLEKKTFLQIVLNDRLKTTLAFDRRTTNDSIKKKPVIFFNIERRLRLYS